MVKPTNPGSVLPAVNAFLDSLDLDERGRALAAIARTLADTLDTTDASTGAALAALAGIAKELRQTLAAVLDGADTADDFVSALMADD